MSIKTGRAEGTADVRIDYERCTVCGLCVEVCSGAPLVIENGKVIVDQHRFFGCVGCGHCMAVCYRQGIMVIFGNPAIKFRRAVRRTFAGIHFY